MDKYLLLLTLNNASSAWLLHPSTDSSDFSASLLLCFTADVSSFGLFPGRLSFIYGSESSQYDRKARPTSDWDLALTSLGW